MHLLHRARFFSDNTFELLKICSWPSASISTFCCLSAATLAAFSKSFTARAISDRTSISAVASFHRLPGSTRALVWPQRSTKHATSCNKSITSPWHKQKRVHLVLIMAMTQNIGCNTPASHLLQSCLVRSVCILHFVSMGSLQQSLNQTLKYSQHLSRAPSLFKLPMFLSNMYIFFNILYSIQIPRKYFQCSININQIST